MIRGSELIKNHPQFTKSPDFKSIIKVIPSQYAPKSAEFGEQKLGQVRC